MADRDALNDEYVRLAVRPHDRPNLFARLPRRVVRQLLRLAAPAPAGDDTPEDVEDTEFLVLEVKHEDGSLVFLSFNGGFLDEDDGGDGSRSNGYPGCIEVPQSFFDACELPDRVLVRSLPLQATHNRDLPTVTTASSLTLQSLSLDEYELLSRHTDRLQGGGLLQQLSVVYPGQLLTLYLSSGGVDDRRGYRRKVQLRVQSSQNSVEGGQEACNVGPECRHMKSIWDGVETASEETDERYGRSLEKEQHSPNDMAPRHTFCWRLVADTELIILPPSETSDTPPKKLLCRLYPSQMDYPCLSSSGLPSPASLGCVSMHPQQLQALQLAVSAANACHRELVSCYVRIKRIHTATNTNATDESLAATKVSQRIFQVKPTESIPEGWIGRFLWMFKSDLRVPIGSYEDQNHANTDGIMACPFMTNEILLRKLLVDCHPFISVAFSRLCPYSCDSSVLCQLTRIELDLELAKDLVEVEIVPLQDVRHLCAEARCLGLRLEGIPVQQHLALSSWRYPDCYRSSYWNGPASNHKDRKSVPIDSSMIATIPCDLRVLPIGSLFALPWNHDPSLVEASHILYRVMVESNVIQGAATLKEGPYVFANDIHRLIDITKSEPAPLLVNLSEPVVFHDRFCLSKALQDRKLYCSSLLDSLSTSSESVLICGANRSGKTTTALMIAAHLSIERYAAYMDCRRLRESNGAKLSTIMSELGSLFLDAAQCKKSLVILDNLDEILPAYGESCQETGSAHSVPQNLAKKDECLAIESFLCHLLSTFEGEVALVVTCDNPSAISNSFLSFISFDCSVSLPLLEANERRELFLDLLSIHDSKRRTEFRAGWREFSRRTTGFRPGDLERLASRVKVKIYEDTGTTIDSISAAVSQELDQYVPLSKLSVLSDDSHAEYGWPEIGGLFEVKREITSIILKPHLYKRIYENAQIRLPRGILLFGPSGSGKSYLVPALAKECGFPLIVCRGPELLSKYIGASESKVRDLFNRAASVAPAILFLDELDALAPRRGTDSTGVTDRVVNQLLTFLDGVEDTGSTEGTVYIIASSSRPDKIDPALLRPGRLERHIYVGNPQTHQEWTDLILQIARQYNIVDSVLAHISSGRFIQELSLEAPHAFRFTAADINAVFHTAQIAAAHETIALGRDSDRAPLRLEHVVEAFHSTRPTLSMDAWHQMEATYESFRGNRREPKARIQSQGPPKVALK